jgi:hypothetical protein
MSMSTHVVGFKAPDEKWRKMKSVWDTCRDAGVDPPDEVIQYFEGEAPDERGVEVDIEGMPCCREWKAEMEDGYEVEITKVPKGVTHVRFYNSY